MNKKIKRNELSPSDTIIGALFPSLSIHLALRGWDWGRPSLTASPVDSPIRVFQQIKFTILNVHDKIVHGFGGCSGLLINYTIIQSYNIDTK